MASHTRKFALAAGVVALTLSRAASSQGVTAAAPPVLAGPVAGEVAPDFTLTGATRYGILKTPVRLSDLRGRTVVLAFFAQARTKG